MHSCLKSHTVHSFARAEVNGFSFSSIYKFLNTVVPKLFSKTPTRVCRGRKPYLLDVPRYILTRQPTHPVYVPIRGGDRTKPTRLDKITVGCQKPTPPDPAKGLLFSLTRPYSPPAHTATTAVTRPPRHYRKSAAYNPFPGG